MNIALAPHITPGSAAPERRVPGRLPRRSTLVRAVSPVLLLVVWQSGSAAGLIPPDVLPAPSLIVAAGAEQFAGGQLAQALWVSGLRVTLGLLLGAAIGIGLGVAVGLSRWCEAALDPPVQMLRALPHLGLIPLFILWFGIGELPKILLVAFGVSVPLYLNTFGAIRTLDPRLFETADVLGFSWWQRLRTVVIPGTAPQVLVGVRQAMAVAWLTLIVAEQINADSGIGFMINNARDFLRIDVVVFGLVLYAALGLLTDAAVRWAERRARRYQR